MYKIKYSGFIPGNNPILVKDKQARILVALRDTSKDWYVGSLAKAAGTTYVHACNFIKECEKLGITTGERHGKTKIVRLTNKGTQLSNMVSSIYSLMEDAGSDRAPEQGKASA